MKLGVRNGYGYYDPDKKLKPGAFKMQFWYGENLLKEIKISLLKVFRSHTDTWKI
jgi:hypothetical protein